MLKGLLDFLYNESLYLIRKRNKSKVTKKMVKSFLLQKEKRGKRIILLERIRNSCL